MTADKGDKSTNGSHSGTCDVTQIRWWLELRARGPESPTTRLVMLALSSYMGRDGSCFPLQEQVAKMCNLNVKTA
ncbi:MAG TPA: helix-turn-helix domain-containing protein [Polyangiaceae bacterium]